MTQPPQSSLAVSFASDGRGRFRVSACSEKATAQCQILQPAILLATDAAIRPPHACYFGTPCATGGKSSSPLTVFLPKYSPPLSRNTATATAISAPRRAPSFPFVVLLSDIPTSLVPDLSANAWAGSKFLCRTGASGTTAALWRRVGAFNEGQRGAPTPDPRSGGTEMNAKPRNSKLIKGATGD